MAHKGIRFYNHTWFWSGMKQSREVILKYIHSLVVGVYLNNYIEDEAIDMLAMLAKDIYIDYDGRTTTIGIVSQRL